MEIIYVRLFMKYFTLYLSFLCFFTVICFFTISCADTTQFVFFSTIKAFDDSELSSESCTQDRIDYLKMLQEGSEKDSDVHSVGSDMYLLMSEGYTLSRAWWKRINRVWKEHDILQHRANSEEEKNLMPEIIELDRKSFRTADKHIRIFKEAIDKMESSDTKIDMRFSDKKKYRVLSEHNKLSANLTNLIAKYFENLIDFCHLFIDGYALTQRGDDLARQLEPLYEDYNDLLKDRIRKGTSQIERQIKIKENLWDIIETIIHIQEEIKKQFVRPDRS